MAFIGSLGTQNGTAWPTLLGSYILFQPFLNLVTNIHLLTNTSPQNVIWLTLWRSKVIWCRWHDLCLGLNYPPLSGWCFSIWNIDAPILTPRFILNYNCIGSHHTWYKGLSGTSPANVHFILYSWWLWYFEAGNHHKIVRICITKLYKHFVQWDNTLLLFLAPSTRITHWAIIGEMKKINIFWQNIPLEACNVWAVCYNGGDEPGLWWFRVMPGWERWTSVLQFTFIPTLGEEIHSANNI